jgi:hypothetical protein
MALVTAILIKSAGELSVNGAYAPRNPTVVPDGFARTCNEMFSFPPRNCVFLSNPDSYLPVLSTQKYSQFDSKCRQWDATKMWLRLSDQKRVWYEADNGSYIYWNKGDGKWWLDGPSGAGLYIVEDSGKTPPVKGWGRLRGAKLPLPTLELVLGKSTSRR